MNPKAKIAIPENSCRNPLATILPKKWARIPVTVTLMRLAKNAKGTVDNTNIDRRLIEPFIKYANRNPSIK